MHLLLFNLLLEFSRDLVSKKKKVLFPDKTATCDHRRLAVLTEWSYYRVVSYFKGCFFALFILTTVEYNCYLAGFA